MGGNIFLALQIETVNRVGGNPEQEPNEGIGEEPKQIGKRGERKDGGPEENCGGTELQIVLQKVKSAGSAEDADEGVKIGRGQHAAAVLLFGAVLD